MNQLVQKFLNSYLRAIDPTEYLTYSQYLCRCNEGNSKPIKREQWDVLISTLAGRKMQDTATEELWIKNLRDAVEASGT